MQVRNSLILSAVTHLKTVVETTALRRYPLRVRDHVFPLLLSSSIYGPECGIGWLR